LGIQTDTVAKFFSENISTGGLIYFGLIGLAYLLAVPITAFIAKRGLFIGADRIWFPGWQEGPGAYLKESEILGSVEAHVHEVPLDLWALGISISLSTIFGLVSVVQVDAWMQSWAPQSLFWPPQYRINFLRIELIFIAVLIGTGIIIAALRRGRAGRA
jgi:hypothetical protein